MTLGERPRWQLYAFVGLLAVVAHASSLGNGFALDDRFAIVEDERIREVANLPGLMTEPYLTFLPPERSPYRPVTTATYVASWAMGNGGPLPFHLFNVLLHGAATVLLLSLLLALGAAPRAAVVAATVFGVHPVHVEAVAGVVGRADVLAAIAALGAVRVVVGTAPGPLRAAALAAMYALGLGAKESAIVIPALVIVVALVAPLLDTGRAGDATDITGDPTSTLRGLVPDVLAMSAVAVLYLLLRSSVLGGVVHVDIASYIAVLSPAERFATAIANVAHVARLFVVPLDLSPEYGPAYILPSGWASWRFFLGASVLATLLVGSVIAIRRGRLGLWFALGVAWFGISWALVSNLVIPLPMWLAERTLYLPSVGLAIGLVAAAGYVAQQTDPRALRIGTMLVIAWTVFGVARSATYGMAWKDDTTLLSDLVERHPESFRAQWWLGGRMVEAGDPEGGVVWLERAADMNPNSALLQLDYVRALLLLERNAEAAQRVQRIPPGLHPSRSVFLAQALIFQGLIDEAIPVVEEGLRFFPTEPRLLDQANQLGISR